MRRQIRQEPTSTATFQTLLEFTCNHRKTTQITTLPLSIQEKPLQYSTLSRMSKVRELAPIMVENPSSVASLQSAGSETGRMKIVDGLCGICSQLLDNLDMFIDKRDEEPPSSHHNSILELRKSAKDGCSLCAPFISDTNYQYYSIPVEDVEIDEGDSETDSESSGRDRKVSEEGIGEVEIRDIQSGSSNIDSSYANPGATGGISFRIYQDKYTPQGHLSWIMRDTNNKQCYYFWDSTFPSPKSRFV